MRPTTWWGLLKQGGFRIHPSRLGLLLGASFSTPINTVLASIQHWLWRQNLAEAELHGPPVFIVGHWRSGTTLLHELMVLDDRFGSPSTFQCFAPHHFLVSEWFFRRFGAWMLPSHRPMDNMIAGWERPQEDEFALMNLGLPSPYRSLAFPCNPPMDLDYLDFEGVSSDDQARWRQALRSFLEAVSVIVGRPLVVKSPTHTGRVRQLAEEFPEAKFIHICRDPRSLYPSTVRLWQGLGEGQSLQAWPQQEEPNPYVLNCLKRMYTAFERDRPLLAANRIVDVRYEDLIADPVATIESIYHALHLADFESARPQIQAWVESEHRQYKPNQHQLDPKTEATLREAWKDYFERYGYA
jgi:omega-hydroxy-beta-dihydromenaquinone-9 sulfotransferase